MVSRGRAAVAGVVSAMVALGVAELIAVLTGPHSAPLIAVGGVVVDSVPEPAKEFAISLFGVHDKTALLVGTAVLLAVFAVFIGLAARLNRWLGLAGIGIFAAIGVAAAVTRPNANWTDALPTLIGCVAALPVLFGLVSSPPFTFRSTWQSAASTASAGSASAGSASAGSASAGSASAGSARPAGEAVQGGVGQGGAGQGAEGMPRRGFAKLAGGIGLGAIAAAVVGRMFSGRKGVQEARQAVQLPAAADPAPALPANIDPAGNPLARYVTSNSDFYRIDTALVTPQVDPAGWTLKIHGRVKNPLTITYAELLAMPLVERYVTLACVSNEVGGDLVGNARWLGVPIKRFLDQVDPEAGADQVVMRSADGWTCGTPTAALRDGRDALLAIGMNGEPLPVEHGFPVRMVVPGLYGYVSACKWIVDMELTTFKDFDAYWIRRGWAEQGPIKTQSRIDVPRAGSTVEAGEVVVAGIAWAQHRGITNVEINTGDGQWRAAELAETVGPDTWRQWKLRWQAAPGKYTLQVRAADNTGELQSSRRTEVFPDGAEGYHEISVTVR
jgi:DMSO/TMAO reductase YedYZ molybdopterin-dependent catalytic subunit